MMIVSEIAKSTVLTKIADAKLKNVTRYIGGGIKAINGGTFAIRNIAAGELDHHDFGATTAYYINNVLAHEEAT